MTTNEDRFNICQIGSQVTGVIDDIVHHEMGDITEGWSTYSDDVPAEIDRLRTRLQELADAAETGLRELRALELSIRVRRVWERAFAAGQVTDTSETDPGDTDQLNVDGVVAALMEARAQAVDARPNLDKTFVAQMIGTLALQGLGDLILERILDTEAHPDDPEDAALETARIDRSEAVIKELILGAYAGTADRYAMRIEVDQQHSQHLEAR